MKLVVLYVALVGLPLAGVFLALHLGRGLTAPPSFGGVWRLATATYEDGCTPPAAPLRIAQSGWRAQVSMGAGAVWADVDEGTLRTRALVEAPESTCRGWHLHAEGRGRPAPETLVGWLVPEGCACARAPFRAARAATGTGPTAH